LLALVVGTIALLGAGAFVASWARLESVAEFVVATYLVAWAWLIVIAFALSPVHLVTRAGLLLGCAAALGLSGAGWLARGSPKPPRPPGLTDLTRVAADPAVAALAVIATLALSYSFALGVAVAPNDWDALTYHLSRAALWKQQHAIGLFNATRENRLNINPPGGEIGQLFVLTLDGRDRFVNAIQFVSLLATTVAVYATARRLGLAERSAAFGALAFAVLPLPLLQASSSLTDLVVASFLVGATCFALSTPTSSLAFAALGVSLSLATKFTGPLAVPIVVAIAVLGPARRRLRTLAIAAAAGIVGGSFWYVVNAVETGRLDGDASQVGPLTPGWIGWRARQYLLGQLQVPGSDNGALRECLYAAIALAFCAATLAVARNGRSWFIGIAGAAVLTALVPLAAYGAAQLVEHTGVDFSSYKRLADTSLAWYGPVATLLIPLSIVSTARAVRAGTVSRAAILLAGAPLAATVLLLALAYDPWRGRFFAYSAALSAAVWGVWVHRRAVAFAVVALSATVAILSLNRYVSKPAHVSLSNQRPVILKESRVDQQLVLRQPDDGASAIRYVSEHVPHSAKVLLALRHDDYIAPYFGPSYRREIVLTDQPAPSVAGEVSWVVAASPVQLTCEWKDTALNSGWHIYKRVSPTCQGRG
jgi:hypothetical protein